MNDKDFDNDVRLSIKGDCNAFARLYERVYKQLYNVALCSLGNPQDACDAVSDTVLDAFVSIHSLRNEKAFRKWIFTILSAKIKRRHTDNFKHSSETLKPDICDDSSNMIFEKIDVISQLETLSEKERLIFSLSVFEGLTSEEISKICGDKASSVRSSLSRIKQKLRDKLSA